MYKRLLLTDLDFIKNKGVYIPENTNVEKLDNFLSKKHIHMNLSYHLRDKKDIQYEYYSSGTYYILDRHHVSRIVQVKKEDNKLNVYVYKTKPHTTEFDISDLTCTYKNIMNYWKGYNTHPYFYRNSWHGNSILIQDTKNHYIEITGSKIFEFRLTSNENIKHYYSIIVSSCVISNQDHDNNLDNIYSISYVVTNNNRIYYKGKYIDDPFPEIPNTPFFSLLYFTYFNTKHPFF
jgi:hypothetical protein